MFQEDIENDSHESQREDYNRTTLTTSQVERLKLKKQLQGFNLHLNYYYFLVQQNREAIEKLVSQLKKQAQEHVYLIRTLKSFMKDQINTFNIISEEAVRDLLSIIKENIQLWKNKMNQDQKSFYESVLDDNKKLSQAIKKSRHVLSEWKVQKLYNLDMISIFFQLSLHYSEYCKNRAILITRDAISYLFDFTRQQRNKLNKIYKNSHTFIRQIENKVIYELINVYHLMMVKNRMFFTLQRVGRKAIDSSQQQTFQKPKYYRQDHQNTSFYNFCQIAFWSFEKDIQQQKYAYKFEIMKQLLEANAQKDIKKLSKRLLFIKIIYGVSFDSMFKLQNFIANNQLKDIRHSISQFKPSKTMELYAKFPYIFIKDVPFDVCFEKSGLSKKYDLKNFDRLFSSKMQAVYTFCRVAFRQNRQLSVLLGKMLKCQQNNNRELIIIKKMVVSYFEITGCQKLVFQAPKQDLTCNLILITKKNELLACCIVRGSLKDQKYIRILKRMMKSISFKRQSVVVLYQNQLGQIPQWRTFYRFHAHVLKKYHFRVYVINAPLNCSLALLVFSYIKMKILNRRQSLTRQNFYEIVEEEIASNIQFLQGIFSGDQK